MEQTLNKLINSLFKKNSISECSIEEIKSLSERFPFFSTIHLLLAKKLKEIDPVLYKEQVQKTSLYFNNPLWLNYLLNEKKYTESPVTAIAEMEQEKTGSFEDFHNDELVIPFKMHEPVPIQGQNEEVNQRTGLPVMMEEKQTADEPALSFEPYHTVDYFASQGIKPMTDDKPTDRFGQQLKSFTEWLKTLKKLPAQEIEKIADTASEQKVIHLAEHSIENRNVETEAMAEVWIKQGQPQKAIEIYSKLSLLNPAKSSYFALLIEELKRH
jgi:hypothetical protein